MWMAWDRFQKTGRGDQIKVDFYTGTPSMFAVKKYSDALNKMRIERGVGAVRERWPHLRVGLHLHDTRGLAVANAHAGLRLGVDRFDSTVGGLGGCPFAGQKGAAGNICTEELVLLCEEMGIATGVDLDSLIEVGRMAERIVGHSLPSELLRAGSLDAFRRKQAA